MKLPQNSGARRRLYALTSLSLLVSAPLVGLTPLERAVADAPGYQVQEDNDNNGDNGAQPDSLPPAPDSDDARPADDARPPDDTRPTDDTRPADDARPAEDTRPSDNARPADDDDSDQRPAPATAPRDTEAAPRYQDGEDNTQTADNPNGATEANPDDPAALDFPATVVTARSAHRLTVRSANGHLYRVNAPDGLPAALTPGARLRVIGHLDDNDTVQADQLIPLRSASNELQQVTFPCTVLSLQSDAGMMRVRGDNGHIYIVRCDNVNRFAPDDRLRIVGTYETGIVTATKVQHK